MAIPGADDLQPSLPYAVHQLRLSFTGDQAGPDVREVGEQAGQGLEEVILPQVEIARRVP